MPDLTQNLLLYIPFGIFGVWTLRGPRPSTASPLVPLMLLALAYSAAMELLQMLLADRIASPLDIVANLAGTVTGFVLAGPTEQALARAAVWIEPTGLFGTVARYALAAVLAAILLTAWYPFDITLDVSTLSQRTRAVRLDPWLWPAPSDLWRQGARYFLLAATTVFCVPKLARWAAPVAIAITVLIALIVDLGQLGMGTQPIGLAAFSSQAAGAFGGAAAALLATLVRGTKYAAA